MEYGALGVSLQPEEAFRAVDLLLFAELAHEALELLDDERPLKLEAERGDIVMMPRFHLIEETRIGLELPVEIEGMDIEERFEPDL